MKIIHTADWHWSKERQDEKTRTLLQLISFGIDNHISLCVVAGDVADKRLTSEEIISLLKVLSQATFPFLFLGGNHGVQPDVDLIQYAMASGFNNMEDKLMVYNDVLVNPVTWLTQNKELDIFLFPHITKTEMMKTSTGSIVVTNANLSDAANNLFMDWKQQITKPSIVVGHFSVDNCMSASGQILMGKTLSLSSDLLNDIGCPVMLGHIHKYQQVGSIGSNVYYSGNPCRTKFDETDEKGFIYWELGKNNEWSCDFVSTNAKKMLTFTGSWHPVEKLTINEPLENIKGNEVKIKFKVDKNDLGTLDIAEIKTCFYGAHSIKLERIINSTNTLRSENIKNALNYNQKLEAYEKLHNKIPNPQIYKKLQDIEALVKEE